MDVLRSLIALLIFTGSSAAHAHFPYKYGPYTPRYPQSAYAPPTEDRSSTPMSQAVLDAHNAIRSRVGVPPLVWSDQLAQVAQDWANHLIATGELNHRPNNRYGENIYAISGGHATPTEAVDLWAKEARGYDIRSNTCSGVCGHYTQNRLGQDPHRWLRCRHRSTARGLGLQLRSARKHHRVPTVLSSQGWRHGRISLIPAAIVA